MQWTDLYVAGRLHKPVRQLVPGPHSEAERLGGLLRRNREYALVYALLQVPAGKMHMEGFGFLRCFFSRLVKLTR